MYPVNRRRRRTKDKVDPAILATWSEKDRQREAMHHALELNLAEDEVGLPPRVVNTLEQHGVIQVKDLLEEEGDDLIAMANLGEKTIKEIIECVKALKLEPPESWLKALAKSPNPNVKKRKK